ncbi:MAG: translation elongation factor Ts [Steroidobacteraceae bacterium]
MAVTAEAVKALRERTGAGMMECKKALVEVNGDLEAAAELMRKQGLAKADKKAARVAAEGVVVIERSADRKRAAIVEVNCETDFVARESDFQQFASDVAKAALAGKVESVEALLALPAPTGTSFEEARRILIAKIGENITVRRVGQIEATGVVGSYLHGSRIGALVAMKLGDEAVARDIAMHVAASSPVRVSANEVPAAEVEKERGILIEQAKGEGKPEAIVAKMVEGRLRKWLNEITLLGQPFVKDPDQSVEKYLKASGGEVSSFLRFEVGAGIEKKQEDFAADVMKQVRGT